MPIDFKKALVQIKNINSLQERDSIKRRLNETYNQFESAIQNNKRLLEKLIETEESSGSSFTFGIPYLKENETVNSIIHPEKKFKIPHIVIGTDGSQIYPSAHELSNASLINIGLVSIPYFDSSIPVCLSSEPTIYNSPDEITLNTLDDKLSDEDLISYERTLKEIESLLELAKLYLKHNTPIVALLDGTLIHWHLKRFNNSYAEYFISRFSSALLEFKQLEIPVASYISNSRSSDIINMLKVNKCPYEKVDCKKHCNSTPQKDLPCNPCTNYKSVMDRKLIEELFSKKEIITGTRTVLFKSTNKILNVYPEELKIFFYYIFSGTEISRVEIPAFVANDKELLNKLHNIISLQCKIGYGYPIILSEAHLQAIVSKNDRQVFYDLLKEHLVKSNSSPVKLSTKELKKRISFV